MLNRPVMQTGQLWFTLLALATGAGLGWAWTLRRRPVWFVLAIVFFALAFTGLVLRIPGM